MTLNQDIAERVEIMRNCPHFQEDNPGITEREMQFAACLHIESLGDDAGGWLEFPTPERRQWRRIRREAMARLRGEFAELYREHREHSANLDAQFC